jgi:NADPH-dependent FMN reductase
MPLNDRQRELCETSPFDFTDLRALFVNCTLKPSPAVSHTQGLIDVSVEIMEANGVAVDQFRAVDHDLAPGVYPDMREHGAARDGWPELYERVQAADVLVVSTPIWLGEKSSVCTASSSGSTATRRNSTTTGSTRSTGRSAGASSPGTRMGSSTAR